MTPHLYFCGKRSIFLSERSIPERAEVRQEIVKSLYGKDL
jgi:hypothetical protein